ncbi:MAG: ATP-dependent transcriptional regulator, MalT-like, LuxR family [Frankiales bacterium]|nr:ATP-dependent transcriptional regulator, MalT-like, LuxR family [Frankiales bacterium]
MTTSPPFRARATGLLGRRAESGVLDQLVSTIRAGESRVLVLRGVPGIGKTVLLDHLVEQASGCTVARATGVQSEMELAFAGLHQLVGPLLQGLDGLPAPQRDALRTAFGVRTGPPPDRFLTGLAVLGLLSAAAEEQPLLCVVDDEQWLDRASEQVLAFVARRLEAESVGLVFGARTSSELLVGLPELVVEGLSDADAHELLASVLTAPLDPRVRDQIVSETRGVPLALLELLEELTPAELAGGFGLPLRVPVTSGIEDSFRRRLEALPVDTQRLLLLAAADPAGDPLLVWRAAERLGIMTSAATPAAQAGLLEIGARVRFRHPLVRSAAYRSAAIADRQAAHRALAEVTDPQLDPDRRAWHRAQAAPGPNEDVALELERSAARAQARGGLAAAAAFLERSVELTLDPAQLGCRALQAAKAKHLAGAPDAALKMLATAEGGVLTELQRAAVDLLRGQIAFASELGSDAPHLLLDAARRLEPIDPRLARETYLETLAAVTFAGRLATLGGTVLDVAHAARAAPPPVGAPDAPDLLMDGLAAHFSEGYAAGLPILRRALTVFGADMSAEEELRWVWLAGITALHVWDEARWDALSRRHVRLARDVGALSELPLALTSRTFSQLLEGELAGAAATAGEARVATEAMGGNLPDYGALALAAVRGREAEVVVLVEASRKDVALRGQGIGITLTAWATALLYNGLGRYEQALAAAEEATAYPYDMGSSDWSLAELVEAATRSGAAEAAAEAHRRLREMTQVSRTDWARGLEARTHALLSSGEAAEGCYRDAIDRLGRTRMRLDLARAHLLYGEWLRREGRRVDARAQLRTGYEMFSAMGADAFTDRARRELVATGETVRKRTVETRGDLTAQEGQIARLARDGLSNPEIGTRLFISPRTVQYHLRKVFTKLGISSRGELDHVLADDPAAVAPR